MTKILITFCARGGSKGVPMKNIKPLCGKPLIQYSVEVARQFENISGFDCDLAISTDDETILLKAKEYGLSTDYIRPAELATDAAGKVETIAHLLKFEEEQKQCRYDYILDLDISSPLRTVIDLQEAFILINSDEKALNLFSVSKAHRNPYFNMVEQGDDGYFKLIKPLSQDVLSRQKAPVVYDLNASFYFYKRVFFDQGFKSVLTDRALIYEVPHLCFDIDNMIDFEIMEFLISTNKLGFEL